MLNLQDLTYRLGPRLLFDRASAALPTGARVGFVGRNGTGKTTLFRMIAGEISPESGEITYPRLARLGRVEQEAPGGPGTLIDFVLAADKERSALLHEAEHATQAERIAEIQLRLVDIDAHSAPARAATILSGLGFDETAQQRSLSEYSGGWRMRVALAAVLFSAPDLLLLDEPTNYLDLEGTLWLISYLKSYPATTLVISHDRDLLDAVSDHILHLDQGRLTVWKGNYSSFEKQRREQQAVTLKHLKKQEEQRKHLQSFVDRFRASATKAAQAQSRLKMLARLEPIPEIVEGHVMPFHFPSPARALSPPIVAMDMASVGYDDRPILSRLSLSIAHDDRIGLLGANGNGKSTFAKLVAGRLGVMSGSIIRAAKMQVGFFAQHQIDDLNPQGTPYTHIAPLMPQATEAQRRARTAQIGFNAQKADTPVEQLSGGEKARLLMGLATFHAPHLLIMDEPTNHLDIDSRAALIEAINAYQGAIILVSHDRYLLEATADRLWVVDGGRVLPFDGDMDDYTQLVLSRSGSDRPKKAKVPDPAPAQAVPARKRIDIGQIRRKIAALEESMAKYQGFLTKIDAFLGDADVYARDPAKAGQLAKQRADLQALLERNEEDWLAASAELEAALSES